MMKMIDTKKMELMWQAGLITYRDYDDQDRLRNRWRIFKLDNQKTVSDVAAGQHRTKAK